MRGQKTASKDDERVVDAITAEDEAIVASMSKLRKLINIQSWVIIGISVFLLIFLPMMQTAYLFHARTPEGKEKRLVGIAAPNLTDKAIRDWAATSVTEMLTMGFGDLETKVMKNQKRFTEEGWMDFIKAFAVLNIRDAFRERQLVLMTAPSGPPVILQQQTDLDGIYKWIVQIPIVMTYITHNNVTRTERRTVILKISRVSPVENPGGIAIQSWRIS
ncbi:MAG: DotI/IcmL family type IV secretion protein [Alphaproteobacteria bacterium]|nr:DotI/IcmL family type IV secretion protein [Alphaproteobacteria bacterium]MCL2505531.1 DotI/IcmL family type IV secretion protein [Alphaproteobacteria bacterium]